MPCLESKEEEVGVADLDRVTELKSQQKLLFCCRYRGKVRIQREKSREITRVTCSHIQCSSNDSLWLNLVGSQLTMEHKNVDYQTVTCDSKQSKRNMENECKTKIK